MTINIDSTPVKDDNRTFSQHQAILTMLQDKLDDPECEHINVLDLACGRAQLVNNLSDKFSEKSLSKIIYFGTDVEKKFLDEAEEVTKKCAFNEIILKTSEIHDFFKLNESKNKFDIITFINSLHEVKPKYISNIFINSILSLCDDGIFYAHDLEITENLELGKVTWASYEVAEILHSIIQLLDNTTKYQPSVPRWQHKKCYSWSFQVSKRHIKSSYESLESKIDDIVNECNKKVFEILSRKKKTLYIALNSLQNKGPEQLAELDKITWSLNDYWAIDKAMEEFNSEKL